MRPMFDPTEDYITVASAEDRMAEVASERENELETMTTILRGMLEFAEWVPCFR